GLLAEVLGKAGRADEGVRVAAEAAAAVVDTKEEGIAAELYRVQADLLVAAAAPGSLERAGECLKRSLAVARGQGAKSWELKAVTSLCRLARDPVERSQMRRLLKNTLDGFAEGNDTADHQVARRLLARESAAGQ